jgi:fumarylacetoacetase
LGSLLELTQGGQRPINLPGGESRTFLQDGDLIGLTGRAVAEGYVSLGFGPCQGVIAPAAQP